MAKYGQIVFQQTEANGFITSTSNGLLQHTSLMVPEDPEKDGVFVLTPLNEAGAPSSEVINIYNNFISKSIDKLGIMAPAGTKFILTVDNIQKDIIVGATGIFELEGIKITGLQLKPINAYTLKSDETKKYLIDGKNKINTAINEFYNYLGGVIGAGSDNTNYQELKDKVLEFNGSYAEGETKYQLGLNGIYEAIGYLPQMNIIIDYRYAEEGQNESN